MPFLVMDGMDAFLFDGFVNSRGVFRGIKYEGWMGLERGG